MVVISDNGSVAVVNVTLRDFGCASCVMVARSPNGERKMSDDLPDMNVAADFYARYDIREVLGKLVSSTSVWIDVVSFAVVLFYVCL